jgi:hypothetical protein
MGKTFRRENDNEKRIKRIMKKKRDKFQYDIQVKKVNPNVKETLSSNVSI